MKKIFMAIALLIATAVFAQQTQQSTQTQIASPKPNLGEVAKKEKVRRENLEKQGKTARVYTKDDIDRIDAKLGIEHTGDGSSAESTGEGSNDVTAVFEDAAEAARRDREEMIARYQSELINLTEQRDDLQKKVDKQKGNLSAGGPYTVNPATAINNINDLAPSLQDLNNRIQELEKQIDALNNPVDAPH